MIHAFQVKNWKGKLIGFPMEDSYNVDEQKGIIAVADGVTMDCKNGHAVRGTFSGALDIMLHYPRPSPSKKAADLFTSEAVDYIYNYISTKKEHKSKIKFDNMDRIFRATFHDINHLIKLENGGRNVSYENINYTRNYPAGCTAALTYLKNGEVFWSYLTDCGVAIISPKGDLKSKTKDEGPGKVGENKKEAADSERWLNLEGRALTRKKFRNNPPEPSAVGILNGMPEAMHYVRTGLFERNPWDYILVYTDGISDIIFKEDGDIKGETASFFRQFDPKGLERFCKSKVSSQGTLVINR